MLYRKWVLWLQVKVCIQVSLLVKKKRSYKTIYMHTLVAKVKPSWGTKDWSLCWGFLVPLTHPIIQQSPGNRWHHCSNVQEVWLVYIYHYFKISSVITNHTDRPGQTYSLLVCPWTPAWFLCAWIRDVLKGV